MKTSHEDSMEKRVIKNTGNLDNINNSATNESKESDTEMLLSWRQKMDWLVWVWGGAPRSGRGKVREW